MLKPTAQSGRKSHKAQLPSEKTIPRAEPYPPIYPDGDGHAIPTVITDKLIQRGEQVKRAALPPTPTQIPAPVQTGPSELELLRREIERLKAENAHLLHDRQSIIDSYADLRRQYDLLNAQMSEKIHEIEILRSSQHLGSDKDSQIRTLIVRIETLESELQHWKYKYLQLEQDQTHKFSIDEEVRRRVEIEISHIRITEKAQWEITHNILIKEKQELESKIAVLTMEVDRLNGLIRHYKEEADGYRRRIDDLTLESRSKGDTDLQMKIVLLSAEVERLSGLLNEKHQEADSLRTRIVDIDSHNARQIEQVKQAHVTEANNRERWRSETQEQIRQGYETQMKELTLKFNNERSVLEADIRQLRIRITELEAHSSHNYEARVRELESKLALIAVELERANFAHSKEIETWREKYSRLETMKIEEFQTIITQNSTLAQRISTSHDETDRLFRLFKELEAEHSVLNNKYQRVSKEVEDIRRVRNSYTGGVDQVLNTTSMLQNVTVRVQSIANEKSEDRDSSISSYAQGYRPSNVLRDSSYH